MKISQKFDLSKINKKFYDKFLVLGVVRKFFQNLEKLSPHFDALFCFGANFP